MSVHKHVSQKVLDANRRNSHHGHGPTTTQGKENVRHNAVTHGLLARALVFKSEKEKQKFRDYRRSLFESIAPRDLLETMIVEDIANNLWRLTRATRWEQAIGSKDDTTAIAEEALESATRRLGILSFPSEESGRGWRCKELNFSLTQDKDSNNSSLYDVGGEVKLTATLADPVGDLDTIIRYTRAIRKDLHTAIDRLLKLQRRRIKSHKSRHKGSDR